MYTNREHFPCSLLVLLNKEVISHKSQIIKVKNKNIPNVLSRNGHWVEPCLLSVDLCHRKRPVSELRSHSLNILYVTKYVLNMYNRDPSETRTLWRWRWSLSGTFCLNEGQHTFVTIMNTAIRQTPNNDLFFLLFFFAPAKVQPSWAGVWTCWGGADLRTLQYDSGPHIKHKRAHF